MSDTPTTSPGERPASTTSSVNSVRNRKQVQRTSAALGVPVLATASFWVEGSLPCIFVGLLFGVGILGSALGVLIGVGAGYGIAWLAVRGRAGGAGLSTILAVTDTELHALRASFWTGRPVAHQRIGSWRLDRVDIQVRPKRFTTAVSVAVPDGRRMRLETSGRKRAAALIARLTGSTE